MQAKQMVAIEATDRRVFIEMQGRSPVIGMVTK